MGKFTDLQKVLGFKDDPEVCRRLEATGVIVAKVARIEELRDQLYYELSVKSYDKEFESKTLEQINVLEAILLLYKQEDLKNV